MYDKSEVAAHFGRAAQRYKQLANVQKHTGEALLRLASTHVSEQNQGTVLDLGCGPAIFADALSARAQRYVGVDIATPMLAQAQRACPSLKFVLADMEALPFHASMATLIYSNLAVQWANSLQALCAEAWRVLAPGGSFVFSTVLDDSLMPLAQLRARYGQMTGRVGAGTNAHKSLDEWQSALTAAGFSIQLAQSEAVVGEFDDVATLIRSVSGIGADYQATPTRSLSRSELLFLTQEYEAYRNQGFLPLTYNVGFVIAYKSIQ